MPWIAIQDGQVIVESSDKTWSTGEKKRQLILGSLRKAVWTISNLPVNNPQSLKTSCSEERFSNCTNYMLNLMTSKLQ